ncbi:MAG: hypothetical protein HY361_00995 [Candidatus Aenigmarchaeota archaeon]|nr:hypothetical protein [Candidatus Aenigmarchaeota archaeon]
MPLNRFQRLYLKENKGVVVSESFAFVIPPFSPFVYGVTQYEIKGEGTIDGNPYTMKLSSYLHDLHVGDRVAVRTRKWEPFPYFFPFPHLQRARNEEGIVVEGDIKRAVGYEVLKKAESEVENSPRANPV